MPELTEAKTDKSPSELDARWLAVQIMAPAKWAEISARVSICLDCRGPALLTDEQLMETISQPQCSRCQRAAAEAAA